MTLHRRPPFHRRLVMAVVLRVLGALHVRGFHAAVLAGLVMMPTVIATGYWSDHMREASRASGSIAGALRGSFDDLAPR